MKKLIILVVLFIMLFIPIDVEAASVTKVEVSGRNEVTIGETISEQFLINISGVQKGASGLGIGGITFKLDFDKSVFTLTNISKEDSFETVAYEDGDSYLIVAAIDETNRFLNKCIDGVLYCSDYLVVMDFFVNDTNADTSSIKMSDVNVILFEIGSDYDESSAVTINSDLTSSYSLSIKKSDNVPTSKPSSISTGLSSENILSNIKSSTRSNNSSNSSNNDNPSSNNYLSSLTVKNYDISFDKNKSDYKVFIDKKVNSLEINATTEIQDSKIEIVGADNLKDNNYQVLIIVTSSAGNKRIYSVRAIEDVKEEKVGDKSIDIIGWIKNNKILLSIIGGSLFIIILIIFIIKKIKDKKIDKMFDNFDRF